MICSYCQADNPAGTASCIDCGAALAAVSAPSAASPFPGGAQWQAVAVSPPLATTPAFAPTPPIASVPTSTPGQPYASASTGMASGTLVIERNGHMLFELALAKAEMLVGRADVDERGMPQIPDIDLTDADPDRVSSRCHARLLVTSGTVHIEDLGSANGTYLEGEGKLSPRQPRPLPTGARVMFGRGGPVMHCRA
jgi:hypothetical protein